MEIRLAYDTVYSGNCVIAFRWNTLPLSSDGGEFFLLHSAFTPCDKWVPFTSAWRVLRLWMKEQPPIRTVAANILNKQSRTADKGWSSRQTKPRTWTDNLVRPKQWKKDRRFGTWNIRSLYRAGSFTAAAWELVRYKLDLVDVQEVRWGREGTVTAGDYHFFVRKRKWKSSIGNRIFCTPQNSISSYESRVCWR